MLHQNAALAQSVQHLPQDTDDRGSIPGGGGEWGYYFTLLFILFIVSV